MAATTVTDNFRNPPSTPDTHFSNPMSLLPKIPGRSPWPGVLVRFGGSRTALLHGFGAEYLLVLHGSDCHLLTAIRFFFGPSLPERLGGKFRFTNFIAKQCLYQSMIRRQ